MTLVDSLGTAVCILAAMGAAGISHSLWLRSSLAQSWITPLDLGASLRGKRIFGDNKKVRGLLVMPLAAALAFFVLGTARAELPAWIAGGLWPVSNAHLAWVGLVAGAAFMLAELPNSFAKRRLQIAPGRSADRGALRVVFLCVDRFDSSIGSLAAISICVPLSWMTWTWALLLGALLHAGFSAVLYFAGVKARLL